MDTKLIAEVWARLLSGDSLKSLGLPTVNNRVDLRGLAATSPSIFREYLSSALQITKLEDLIAVRGISWKDLDFSKAQLQSLRLFDCTIENCCFDGADCQDWRMWGMQITDTSFRSANLRRATLGAVDDEKRNIYVHVDFTKADLRQTSNKSAQYNTCTFINTKLKKVDFQGSVFRDCKFSGLLEEVLFYDHAFRGETLPCNEMNGVDFRHAQLHHVEFRRLDMTNVMWPEDDEHIIVSDYVGSLDRALAALAGRTDASARRLSAFLEMKRKWAGPHQKVGVISKYDLTYSGGNEAVDWFLSYANRQTSEEHSRHN